MSPWKVLGWLLVALLCLLLTAGAYGLALLWGWSLPSVWWLAAIAGAGAGVALIIFLFRTMRDDTHEPAAPLPVELPSERLPRWLLLDGGELFPHLPGILESAGRPLLSDGAAENAGSVGLCLYPNIHIKRIRWNRIFHNSVTVYINPGYPFSQSSSPRMCSHIFGNKLLILYTDIE